MPYITIASYQLCTYLSRVVGTRGRARRRAACARARVEFDAGLVGNLLIWRVAAREAASGIPGAARAARQLRSRRPRACMLLHAVHIQNSCHLLTVDSNQMYLLVYLVDSTVYIQSWIFTIPIKFQFFRDYWGSIKENMSTNTKH